VTIKVDRSEAPLAQFYVESQPWTKEAACRGLPVDVFFDECEQRDTSAKLAAVQRARAICFNCPVLKQCANQAMVEEGSAPAGRYGFRGGMTAAQRRVVYRRGGLKGKSPKHMSVQGVR
jgi:WhiB family redox-sensing transcriptional regulator